MLYSSFSTQDESLREYAYCFYRTCEIQIAYNAYQVFCYDKALHHNLFGNGSNMIE